MFTGNLIMRPVAYDAFSAGISGRTFAKPIASTPPFTSSRQVRTELQWVVRARPRPRPVHGREGLRRRVRGRGGKRLATEPLELAQIAQVGLPAPAKVQVGRQPHRVLVGVEQLVDQQRELLGQLHHPATAAAGSTSSIGTGMD